MEAKELRIGNYINSLGQEFNDKNQFVGWKNYVIKVDIDVLKNIFIKNKDFKYSSIPLTEEWLLKFGFYKVNMSWYNELCPFAITNWIRPDNNTHGYSAELNHINLCDLVYIHDLQNLNFALTGEELKYQK